MACCGGRKESDVSQHGRAIYDLTKKKKKKTSNVSRVRSRLGDRNRRYSRVSNSKLLSELLLLLHKQHNVLQHAP